MNNSIRRRRRGALHIGRYGEILSVFVKYGFGDIVSSLNLEKYGNFTRRFIPRKAKEISAGKQTRWERVRLAIEELGPTFIKFGQFLSNRPDLLPEGLILELIKLQDSVSPFPAKIAIDITEKELKKPIAELFREFDEKPLASASVAQVHKAIMHNGKEVAVKVQRAGIKQMVATDIDILSFAVSLIERQYERARPLNITQLVDEFERVISRELDFLIEAAHMERFTRMFTDDPRVIIPGVYAEHSTKKVLTTDFVHGIKISHIDKLEQANLNCSEIAEHGTVLVLRQIFDHGFFHADPHPGNILVRRDGAICFLDFGAVGIIPPSLRYHLSILLYGVVKKDPQRIIRSLTQVARRPIRNIESLEYDIAEFIEDYSLTMLKELDIGNLLNRFSNIVIEHDLRVIPGFYLLFKALISIEGVGSRLDPDFSLIPHLEPFVKKMLRDNPRIKHLPYDIYFMLTDAASLAKDLPFEIKEIVRIIKSGELRIQFEHRGLEPLIVKLDQIVNKLVFAIVLGALIVGTSLVVRSDIPLQLFGVPVIAIAGFLIAGFIGFGLLFSMLRNRRM
ncbi:MAG: phosphotransferase [Chitinivibrionales bacterium]|nr:phosphotransferase [Chitinivibrionales bacterium]